jgi:hypothetical protein
VLETEDVMPTRSILLAIALLTAGSGVAVAQNATSYDTGQLPAIQGKVAEYSLTLRGDVDGLILADGTEVHLPPHLGTQLVFAVRPGDTVTVRGLRTRAIPLVQAMSISNDATGSTVTDSGPNDPRRPSGAEQHLTAQGHIKAQLHGPQGEVNGALLEDGTIIRLPPPEAERLVAELAPGAPLCVQGDGVAGPLGRVIEARSIGPNSTKLAEVAVPVPPGPGWRSAPSPPPGGPAMEPPDLDGPPPPARMR